LEGWYYGFQIGRGLAKEAASLSAAQAKQQLAGQSLSIANQAPQSLLSLFQ
jgi:flagellin